MDDFETPAPALPARAPEVAGYDVGRLLGRGGTAVVWLATDRATRRNVALKCFSAGGQPGDPLHAPDAEEAVRREVRILSALDHQHLVRAHAVARVQSGTDNADGLALVLDYAPGGSLAELIAARGCLGPGETVTVLTPIAQVLGYLHGQGFTHGDVSPGNVLFTAQGMPLLADLGVGRMVADPGDPSGAGTDGFRDPAPVDAVRAGLQPEADVYSVAALGWFCLTGRAPEPEPERPPLPLLVPGVPAGLAEALEAGLRLDRRRRPTAAELAAAIFRSAPAAPVDLSVSVHPTVLPQLLTRRSLPATARELRWARLRAWRRRLIRRQPRSVEVPARPARARSVPAGSEETSRRQTSGRHASGRHTPEPRASGLHASEPHTSAARTSGRAPERRAAERRAPERPASGPRKPKLRRRRPGPRRVAALLVLTVMLTAGMLAASLLARPSAGPGAGGGAGHVPGHTGREAPASGAAAVPAGAIPAELQELLAAPRPEDAVRGLAGLRSYALSTGKLGLLEQVTAPASSAAAADARIAAQLADSRHVLDGFETRLSLVALQPESTAGRAVVSFTMASPPYRERDAAGAVVGGAAAAVDRRLRAVLVPLDGRWRIQEILPGPAGGQ